MNFPDADDEADIDAERHHWAVVLLIWFLAMALICLVAIVRCTLEVTV